MRPTSFASCSSVGPRCPPVSQDRRASACKFPKVVEQGGTEGRHAENDLTPTKASRHLDQALAAEHSENTTVDLLSNLSKESILLNFVTDPWIDLPGRALGPRKRLLLLVRSTLGLVDALERLDLRGVDALERRRDEHGVVDLGLVENRVRYGPAE
jgi:hypothetical protein